MFPFSWKIFLCSFVVFFVFIFFLFFITFLLHCNIFVIVSHWSHAMLAIAMADDVFALLQWKLLYFCFLFFFLLEMSLFYWFIPSLIGNPIIAIKFFNCIMPIRLFNLSVYLSIFYFVGYFFSFVDSWERKKSTEEEEVTEE